MSKVQIAGLVKSNCNTGTNACATLRGGDDFGLAPEALEVVIDSGFFGEDVDQVVAVIGKHPFGVGVAFDADRVFAALFQLQADLLGDGLDLLGIGSAANQEEVGEGSDLAQV